MNLVLLGILGYVVLQVAIGFAVSRRIRNEADYLVAGRRLGYPLAIFSIFATWFGAETCIGAAGGVYGEGLSATAADPCGYALCIFLMAAVFAVPLWKRKLITLADLFRQRFSPGVERFAAILMIPTSVLWAGAQIRAFGQVLASSSDALSVPAAITIATCVVLAYTIVGGLLADAYTDLVQGVLLMIGLLVLFVAISTEAGGLAASLARVDPERVRWRAPETSWLESANTWSVPVFGSLMAQELISRVSAARSEVVARRSAWIAGFVYLGFGLIPVYLGLVGPELVPGLEHGEQILPELAERYLHTFGRVLFVGVLVAAILSTVDSALLVAGSLLSHNLVVPLLPRTTERGKVRAARVGVFAFGLCAFGLALASESVLALVEEASGFGSQGILVIACFGLFTRFGARRAAYSALALGVSAWILAHFVHELPYDYLLALAVALGGYVAVGLIEARPRSFASSNARPAHRDRPDAPAVASEWLEDRRGQDARGREPLTSWLPRRP